MNTLHDRIITHAMKHNNVQISIASHFFKFLLLWNHTLPNCPRLYRTWNWNRTISYKKFPPLFSKKTVMPLIPMIKVKAHNSSLGLSLIRKINVYFLVHGRKGLRIRVTSKSNSVSCSPLPNSPNSVKCGK